MLRLILTASLWTVVCLIVAALYLCLSFQGRTAAPSSADEEEEPLARATEPLLSLAAEKVFYEALPGDATISGFAAERLEVLRQLAAKARVVVVALVADDAQQARLQDWFARQGLFELLPPHRLLFCETPTSRTTVVRQLNPTLHLESNPECMELMARIESIRAAQVADAEAAWGFLGSWGKNLG